MTVLVTILGVLCIALAAGVFVLHRRLLAERVEHVAPRVLTEVITVEITNHVDVAAGRTSLARPIGRIVPGVLRSIVHRETVRMMRTELAAQGVVADVRVRRVPVRVAAADPEPDPGPAVAQPDAEADDA